jgi:Toxin YafO, type II toxin-antitoxin system
VHLKPIEDESGLLHWMRQFGRRSRKTSDRVLVYTVGSTGNFLLIFILPEPDAHKIAREHPQTMQSFARVAAAFINDGTVIG